MACKKADDEAIFGMGTVVLPASHGIGHVNEAHVCSYEESHVIFGDKYLDHIAKCRQRKEGRTVAEDEGSCMQICPYNPRHHVHHSVMDKHIQICDGYYKYQMDQQLDPLSMAETCRRYDMVVAPVDNKDQDCVDDSSVFGDDDGDAPIHGIQMVDIHGKIVIPKTRNEFRRIQGKIAKKLVKLKLKEMSKKKDSGPDSSRASTPCGDGYKSFNALPELSYGERMRNVAVFANKAREQLGDK